MDITFEDVTYVYQKNTPFAHQALQNVSLHIPAGKYVAIVGHTGSGKSTLIQHLNGLIRPSKGKVNIGNYELTKESRPRNMKDLRSQVGIVFQYPEHQLFEENVAKDIAFGPKNFGVSEEKVQETIKQVIRQVGLSSELLKRSPFELSGGQMRRVAIAGVLAVQPHVLVLDEPTAGLDPRGQTEMMQMFSRMHEEANLTTVLVTHSMELALAYADHVIILNNGTVHMEGAPIDVFMQEEALQAVDLDQPEIIQFLKKFEHTFGERIPYEGQSIKEIAKAIQYIVKGVESP